MVPREADSQKLNMEVDTALGYEINKLRESNLDK